MKRVIGLASVLLLASASDPIWRKEFTLEEFRQMDAPLVFETWAKDFDKVYATEDEKLQRFQIWLENAKIIGTQNGKESSFKLRFNQFGDLTTDEFRMAIHGHTGSCFKRRKTQVQMVDPSEKVTDVPDSVDWTTKGVVTPVKNQGQCGSCWAFSATGATECQYAIKNGDLVSLSEQQLVDCSDAYGNEGCDGGFMEEAFRYIHHEGGLCSESEYPYKAKNGECKASSCGTLYDNIDGFTAVTKDNEPSLKAAAAEGCVSVGIEADQYAFQFYSSGVLDGTCGTSIDHGVLVVGYGTQNGQDYWKVKNSWGTSWGEEGYVLICRNCNKNNGEGECGILEEPSYPNAASK